MISLPAQMPLLQVGPYEVVHYEKEWIQEAIMRAAEEAGHEKWWFAEDIAKGMILYLQKRFRRNTITLQELFDKIAKTLTTIGFSDVAEKLKPTPPPMRISLFEIAREAGSGYELVFFELLGKRLHDIKNLGVEIIQCSELKHCVKHLKAVQDWSRDCDILQSEIVDFVHQKTETIPAVEPFSLVVH